MERMTFKRFYVLVLIPVLLLGLYSPLPEVRADSLIDDLVYYGLTVSGYMGLQYGGSGGGEHDFGVGLNPNYGTSANKTLFQNLRDAVQYAYDNHHINVNTAGDISFDSTATSNFYNTLTGGGLGGYSAKYFSGSNPNFSIPTNVTTQFLSNVNTVLHAYTDSLIQVGYTPYYNGVMLVAYDISNIVGLYCSGGYYGFLTASGGNPTQVPYTYIGCTTDGYNDSPAVYSGTTYWTISGARNIVNHYPDWTTIPPEQYNSFPGPVKLKNYPTGYISFKSTKPLILGLNAGQCYGGYQFMQSPTYVCPNVVSEFPTISADQYNTNNYENVYNTYVTNVNNNYQTLNNTSFDFNSFNQIAQDQNNLLLNAIDQGVDNIVSVIQTQSQKLDTIIGLLMHIRDMLKELPSGVGSSSGSAVSVDLSGLISRLDTLIANNVTSDDFDDTMSDLQDALDSISSSASSNNTQLIAINNKLIDLYAALIGSQNSPRHNPNDPSSDNFYYGDNYWIDHYYLKTIPDNFMDYAIDNIDDLFDLLDDCVPFCFIWAGVNLISAFATQPEAPCFTIPFTIDSFGIDEEITIDFSDFALLHTILTDGLSILFLIGMWFLFFRILNSMFVFFGG